MSNVRVRGFDELKIRSVLSYMTDLKIENNEDIGHYGQTLIRKCLKKIHVCFFTNARKKKKKHIYEKIRIEKKIIFFNFIWFIL